MRVRGRWAFVTVALLALVLIGSALAATAGHRTAQAKAPIIIGWAFDGNGRDGAVRRPCSGRGTSCASPGSTQRVA